MKIIPIKRALLSVSDKTNIVEFARDLLELGIDIISTGGTSDLLKQAGIPHRLVEEITGWPQMLDGRVKTLHPKIHGGILAKRDQHDQQVEQHGIHWIDLVVVNFYPFSDAIKNSATSWDTAVEQIDIGGPTLVRAAAKNFAWVSVVIDPLDYASLIETLRKQSGLSFKMRKKLAEQAFAWTAHYDSLIYHYFLERDEENDVYPSRLHLQLSKMTTLRYGENPHQSASLYQLGQQKSGILSAVQRQGKPLSYNNILDIEAAFACISEFATPTCVIVKHANPCGAASLPTIDEAYRFAYEADSLSAFGGIIALNRPCTKRIAEQIASIFVEIVLAPAYSQEALAVLSCKQNLRLLEIPEDGRPRWEMKFVTGGVLLQEKDTETLKRDDLKVATRISPREDDIKTMLFAWHVLKHVKSNGILIAKQNVTVGIGAGQVSRIDAVDLAIRKAGDKIHDAILASDAFFPFRDSIDRIAKTGIRAIIQPGGSVRDAEVIAACDEYEIAMVMTGRRCFRH